MPLRRILLTVLGATGLLVPAVLAAPSAQAISYQTICNSTASLRMFTIDVPISKVSLPMYSGRCESVPRGGTVITIGRSYRVKYRVDGKDTSYSECRSNSGFTPWSKADRITFKTYEGYYC